MSTNKKAGAKWKETRHDKFYHLAKEQGYRSRAAFKLIQLNKKFDFLSSCKSCLDLCAAPGGWLQVASKYMPVSSMIVGVDLLPIRPIRGVTTLIGDITSDKCRADIKKQLQGWDVDVVLHDGAPNVAGGQSWSKDAYQQVELVIHSLKLATHFLRPQGTFATKIFRSQDYNSLLWVLQQFFHRVEIIKPSASRAASAEIFALCTGYLAPKKIDPRLLDPNTVFQQFDVGQKKIDIFNKKTGGKSHRSREGYDEDMGQILSRTTSVLTFIEAEDPIDSLGRYTSFTFDIETHPSVSVYLNHVDTTDEIKELCKDLQVLGKGDFKNLLKWRKKMIGFTKELQEEEKRKKKEEEGGEEEEGEKEVVLTEEEKAAQEEEAMEQELAMLKNKKYQQLKREKKKKHEMKMKANQRLELNANNLNTSSDMIASSEGDGLFSIKTLKNSQVLENLELQTDEINLEEALEDEDEGVRQNALEAAALEAAGEEEEGDGLLNKRGVDEEKYYAKLEQDLDAMYQQYKEKKRMITQKKKKEKLEMESDEEVMEEEEEEDGLDGVVGMGRKRKRSEEESSDDDDDENDDSSNPLISKLGDGKETISSAVRTSRWFQQDLFADVLGAPNSSSSSSSSSSLTSTKKSRFDSPFAEHNGSTNGKNSKSFAPFLDFNSDSSSEEEDDEDESSSYNQDEDEMEDDEDDEEDNSLARSGSSGPKAHIGLGSLSKSTEQLQRTAKRRAKKERAAARAAAAAESEAAASAWANDTSADDRHVLVDLDSAKKRKKMERKARRDAQQNSDAGGGGAGGVEGESGFEEVAAVELADMSDDSDSQAQVMALGQLMLRKKSREELVNSSYNRYSVDSRELENLPEWFVLDEQQHNQAQLPVTREQVRSYKSQLQAINARPIKKIAEARARKKMKTLARWEKIKSKADAIAADEGGNQAAKLAAINKLYHKSAPKKKADRRYQITKKGGGSIPTKNKNGTGGGGKTVLVDSKMKKDKRGAKHAAKNNKKRTATMNKRKAKK